MKIRERAEVNGGFITAPGLIVTVVFTPVMILKP